MTVAGRQWGRIVVRASVLSPGAPFPRSAEVAPTSLDSVAVEGNHPSMRRGSGLCLVVVWVAVAALVGLLGASSASASKASRTVVLKVRITGFGTVHVPGRRPFTCRSASASAVVCSATFHVRRGKRVAVEASPLTGWKLTAWGGACKGTSQSCSLKLKVPRSVAVTFVRPGDRLNPYPLGTTVDVAPGFSPPWAVKVVSAQSEGPDWIVDLEATNSWDQTDWTFALADWMFMKQGGAESSFASCSPPDPNFLSVGANVSPYGIGAVAPGQTVTGNLCFPIETSSSPAELFVMPAEEWPPLDWLVPTEIEPPNPPPRASVWFALPPDRRRRV